MKSNLVKSDKFNFVVFENIFNEEELGKIWIEVTFLSDFNKLKNEQQLGSAYEGNKLLKKGYGIWLDEMYTNRHTSNYLRLYKKPFSCEEMDDYFKQDYTLNLFRNTNRDNTLINYYADSNYYEPHLDNACYSYVFWLFREPRMFTGGEFYFPDIDCELSAASNCGVLFPSWAKHGVKQIENNVDGTEFAGRFSFSTFFHI